MEKNLQKGLSFNNSWGAASYPSLILFVLSTLSMSMRILYLTLGGKSALSLWEMSGNTIPAQNFWLFRRPMDLLTSLSSLATGSSLSRLTH